MYHGSYDSRPSAKHNTSAFVVTATIEGEKQKQKKRLSFKEPEIEPRQNFVYRPQPSTFKHSSSLARERNFYQEKAESLEDLTLEDQALKIVKNVGQAFVGASRDLATGQRSPPLTNTKPAAVEVKPKEVTTEEKRFGSRNYNYNRSDAQSSQAPPTPPAMRCPVIEIAAEDDDKAAGEGDRGARVPENSSAGPKNAGLDLDWPTGARHQIQLLNLQLEQQRQQTQTAMSQIQLLKDQLEAEGSARYQAQVQNQQLMNQNRDLVNQIQQLFQQIEDLEKQVERFKKSNNNQQETQAQELKQGTLPTPSLNQCGYRRNSASLWSSTLSPTLGFMGRRNSATQSPTPQQEQSDSCQKQFLGDSIGRRTSIADDLTAVSALGRFGGVTDWRLRRRGSSNLNFDFPSRIRTNSISNGFSAIEDPSPPPVDRTKISPLFSPEPKLGTVPPMKLRPESLNEPSSNACKDDSLLIDESRATARSNLWSKTSFKPIDPDEPHPPTYAKKQAGKQNVPDKQAQLAKSLETLRLFNS